MMTKKEKCCLIARRYETGSLIITSNQPISDWDQKIDSGMMAVAAIDHLAHHDTILEFDGESYRMKASLQRRGGPNTDDN